MIFPDESSEKRPASTTVVPALEPDRKKDQLPASSLRLNEFGVCGKAVPPMTRPRSNPISRNCPDAKIIKAPGVGSEGTVERCRATVRPYAVAAGEKEYGKGASRTVVVFDTVCNCSAATNLERACCIAICSSWKAFAGGAMTSHFT